MTMLIIVGILVLIVVGLIIYNITIHKKIQKFKNMNQRITNLYVVQDFMNAIGETSTVDEKIKKINDILIDRYEIKYSTIVVFDGTEYQVKASNVDQKHWDALRSLHDVDMFKDSIESATPKYVTVNNENERLPYQKMEFGRAKSAMFFPLYIDNVYIGYWIIESGQPHDFDNIDTTILEVVKNNIISVIKTVEKQNVVENIVRDDKFTGLKSEEYLYGEGKRKLDEYTMSAICMFNIINIVDINETLGRHTGNDIITKVSQVVRQNIAAEYIFVRYMGPKFVIVFSGIEVEGINEFMVDIKKKLESIRIEQNAQDIKAKTKAQYTSPKVNIVVSTYYKGTALEGTTKKLEEYLDAAPKDESEINYI